MPVQETIFGTESVRFHIHDGKPYYVEDVDRIIELPYEPTHVVLPLPLSQPHGVDSETKIRIPQRRQTIVFQHTSYQERSFGPNEEDTYGPYLVDDDYEFPPVKLLLPQEYEAPVFQSLRNIYDEIYADLSKGRISLYDLSSREFEEFIASVFENQGWGVELTQATRDGGYDVIATRHNPFNLDFRIIIECKRYSQGRRVGIGVIRELWGVLSDPDNKFHEGIVATTSYLSRDASKAIERKYWNVRAFDHDKIMEYAGFKKSTCGLWVPH